MSYRQLAVETARYHSRMAVRDAKWFTGSTVQFHRGRRDYWIREARK